MTAARRTAALAVAALLLIPTAARAAPGPALTEPAAARLKAIRCAGDLRHSPRPPVLLVHGTGVTPEENWSETYEPALLRQGHSVCTVAMPQYGWVDVQRSAEYVVTAIREMAARSGRRISIIGHSQGGFQPVFALRVWPDLAGDVDDFVGLSGAYDRGAASIGDCSEGCSTAFWQVRPHSALLTALARRTLPSGPSYTAIGTLADAVVTPQPAANELPPGAGADARSVEIQDICPGRRMPGDDHILMAGDAVAYALAMDALDHPGPADPARIPRDVCGRVFFDGVDYLRLPVLLPAALRTAPDDAGEVPLRCYLLATCTDADARGRMLAGATARRTSGGAATLTLVAQAPGTVRVGLELVRRNGPSLLFPAVARRAPVGTTHMRIARRWCVHRRCSALPAGRYRVTLATRPDGFTADAVERRLLLRLGRRA